MKPHRREASHGRRRRRFAAAGDRAGAGGGGRPAPGASGGGSGRGTLFVVATPIGNLDDLSFRALATLRACRLLACEDTRVTRAILDRHALAVPLMSCHKFNEAEATGRVLEVLAAGGDVALVSDGGTPGLSDPGAVVVREARRSGSRIVPIPGPSAATALWSVSGFSGPFAFHGFLPARRGERRRALRTLAAEPRPLILYESPHRIVDMLDDAVAVLGDRDCCLGREMTKIHEEVVAGRLSWVRDRLAAGTVRGEIALVVDGRPQDAAAAGAGGDLESAVAEARRLMAAGSPRVEAARRAARAAGVPRRAVYRGLLGREDSGAQPPGGAPAAADDGEE